MLPNKIILLKTIRDKQSLSVLLKSNISYSKIALLLNQHIEEGNISVTSNNIVLTPKGTLVLENALSKTFSKKKDQWIYPQYYKRKPKIDVDKIVLPNKT